MGTQAVAASHGGGGSGGGGGGGGGRQKAQGLQGFSAQSPIYGFDEFLHTAIPPSTVAGGAEMSLEGFLMKVRATAAVDGGGDNGGNLGRGAVSGGYVGRAGPAQQLPEAAPQTLTRKRGGAGTVAAAAEEVAEKTVERRQKRMIKNRESAARSRARKQAYTNELENKVSRLEAENERLKRQKELEPVIHFVPQPEPKHQLRRTSSALF